MTKFIITDPSEAAPNADGQWTGYWSLDIVEYGEEVVASMNFSPDMVPNVEDPDQLAETFEEMATAFRGIADGDDEGE